MIFNIITFTPYSNPIYFDRVTFIRLLTARSFTTI